MENVSFNLGPLTPLFQDDSISEIMVNDFQKIFVEKDGKFVSTNLSFPSEKELMDFVFAIAKSCGREVSKAQPFFDGYLPDGSRVNAAIPPMAPRGATLSIRRFRKQRWTLEELLLEGALSHKAAYFLHASVVSRANILISGGTGTGKTTFLNALANLVPPAERIVSIEDVGELQLSAPNWVRLESSVSAEGKGISTRTCVANALRMRPDRIIVGECRKDETFEMLQAMNTGHPGSMTTMHANSPRECLIRLESLVLMSGVEMPLAALRRQMASAIDLIVQLKRGRDGLRYVDEIVEVTGIEDQTITSQVLFSTDQNKIIGAKVIPEKPNALMSTGLVPQFVDKFTAAGIQFPPNFYDPKVSVTYRPE